MKGGHKVSKIRALFNSQTLGALGIVAAGLLLSEINLLSSRHYWRLDVSEGTRYSLSSPTRRIINQLAQPIDLYVFLTKSDPRLGEARQLLLAYEALTSQLRIQYIDPDRDTAQFLALGRKFDIASDAESSGGVVANASLLITNGKKRWFIRSNQLSKIDQEGRTHSLLEAQITEGIARVQSSEESRVCFVTGHGERSLDDGAPEGLLELRSRLTKSNIVAERVAMDVADPQGAIELCDAIAVMGPSRPWPPQHEQILVESSQQGRGLLLFLDPIINEHGAVISHGLESLNQATGTILKPNFVLERDPEQRLPSGLGEAFFATPKTHPLTRGLSTEAERVDARVLFLAATALRGYPGMPSVPLLLTSSKARFIDDLKFLDSPSPNTQQGDPLTLAMAMEAPTRPGKPRGVRSVTVGSSNLAWNRSFREPALYGNRLFVENAFSWVLSRPALVSVPERPPAAAGLNLSEDSLSELLRYVLVYMPLAAACAGAFFLTRRRNLEEASRQHPKELQ